MTGRNTTSRLSEQESEKYLFEFRSSGMAERKLREDGVENISKNIKNELYEFFSGSPSLYENQKLLNEVTEKIFQKISQDPRMKISNLDSMDIENGLVIFVDTQNHKIAFNLVDLWRETFLDPAKSATLSKTREEERQLQEIVAKEAFYNGNVVMEYVLGTAVLGLPTVAIGTTVWKMLYARSMLVTMEDGSKQRITFKKPYVGTREAFQDSISRIMEFSGFHYDTKLKKFFRPTARLLKAYGDDLKNLDYKKFSADPNSPKISENEFNHWKQRALAKQQTLMGQVHAGKISAVDAGKEIASTFRISGKDFLVGLALFPVFATEFHKDHTPKWFAEALFEEVGGMLGVATVNVGASVVGWRAGMAAGLKAPGWLKLAGWAIGAVGGNWFFKSEFVDVSRRKWLVDGTQEMYYNDNRNKLLHWGSSFGINEIMGGVNNLWRDFTGDKNAGGIDIGVDSIDIINPITGWKITTIPEVTIFQDKLNMGTAPWEWIKQSTQRDVHEWNRYVDMYKVQLTKAIYDVLGKYQRGQGVFWDSSLIAKVWGKEKLLEQTLEILMKSDGGSNIFSDQISQIVSTVTTEMRNNSNIPNSVINEMIALQVGSMKINWWYKIEREAELNKVRAELIEQVPILSRGDQKINTYLLSIPNRMLENKPLFSGEEENIFKKLLSDTTTKITISNQELSVGHAMALWLDSLVAWQNEKDFINRLNNGSATGIKWS